MQDLFLEEQVIISSKLTDEQLLKYIKNAAKEYEKLLDKQYLIVGKNKNSGYFWFQCEFKKKQFMHLLGIKSDKLSADEFFEKALNDTADDTLDIDNCNPSRNHNRTTINEKVSCCADMLKIANAKYLKVGEKDKISQHVDFMYAYGNEATLGFQVVGSEVAFPITLIPRGIDEFSSQKYKIIFVFEKMSNDSKYEKAIVEIKKNIFDEHYEMFPDELKELFISDESED